MKLFLDTADITDISNRVSTGLIDGITTNPTLIMKSSRNPYDVYREITLLGINDISMEVVGHNAPDYVRQGYELYDKFGDVATIKLPCTPDGLMACKELSSRKIRVNITLIFNSAQAVLAAKAGATYVSPFVGRLADNSISGTKAVEYIASLYRKHDVKTQIIAASIRDVHSVTESFHNGAHVCTIPPSVFDKMYCHVLTDVGIDTFIKDWEKVEQARTEINQIKH